MTLTVFFECKERANKADFMFTADLPPFDKLRIPFYVDCQVQDNPAPLHHLIIESGRQRADVVKGGITLAAYSVNKSAVTVLEEISTSEFWFRVDDKNHTYEIKESTISYDNRIMKPVIYGFSGINATAASRSFFIFYNCIKTGRSHVKLTVEIGDKAHPRPKIVEFGFTKVCLIQEHPSRSYKTILLYAVSILILVMSCWLIKRLAAYLMMEQRKQTTYQTLSKLDKSDLSLIHI
eukprot:TRINITY_DN14564_c0_g1_i1.p1 TRINITY_DN14564_c0_g1~~TRINITY_DN14564_c0_g1_i1.p1  ORF type:complete len:236 (-),score=35.76 TRINITY_DN14564_c0_g1_i1:60-767(-)